ncbi:MAG TPA: tetratricopeptide repeat protein [Terracidiphilus sp.]
MRHFRLAAQFSNCFASPPLHATLLAISLCLACSSTYAIAQKGPVPGRFSNIESLIQQRRFAEAKTAVLDELKHHPASVEGYNLLGIIATNQRDYAGAIASLQKALQLNPRSTRTHNNLGNVYVAQQQAVPAENEFRAVLRLDPANAEANYNLGVLLMMKGSPAAAIPHFERVHPSTTAAQFNLVRAYLQTKRTADALRVASQFSEQAKSDVQVHFSLGVLLATEQQYKPAQLELEKADALQPGTFEILYNLGQAQLRTAEYAKAQVTLSRALKLKPESAETMYLLARVYNNQSRPLDALDLLVHAHKLAPENTDIVFLMAQVSMSQNYYEDAIPLLESGLQLTPKRADLLAALGESYFMAGKVEKAIEVFKKLLEIDNSARSYAFVGLSYRNLGRFDEATQYFQQGLKLDPHNATCLFNLGFIAERQGEADQAESFFQQTLKANPDFADALLELANIRLAARKFAEAEELLRRYVKVSRDPATGYYKLAMAERGLHETADADRDLGVFRTLSKNVSAGPLPYQHLFDYLDNRSTLAPGARAQLEVDSLLAQLKTHPEQPQDLYLLAEAYLKSGKFDEARDTIAQLDKLSASDYRTLTGTGVLLARYHLFDDAIQHFQAALQANPTSDEIKFDLANAYFRKHEYSKAMDIARQVSAEGQKDDAFLNLLGDIYAHVGDAGHAAEIFRDGIVRNPDNDQNYLSLALIDLRANDLEAAQKTLAQGQARIPASGKIYWGLGLTSAMRGNTTEAAQQLERAVELLPEWGGGYSTLGVFYFQIGKTEKAREVLNRFRESSASGSLEIDRIQQVLDRAPAAAPGGDETMTAANKEQLLQLALSLADRTL